MLEVPGGDPAEPFVQEAAVDPGRVLETAPVQVVVSQADTRGRLDELRDAARGEEHVRTHRSADEHVVIRVQKVLGQTFDVLQLGLDRLRVVRGQHGRVGEVVLAAHERHIRVVGEPRRRGRVRHDEDALNPRGEHVEGAQGVLQLVDLLIAGFRIVHVADDDARHLAARAAR